MVNEILRERIIELSEANSWHAALYEWILSDAYWSEEPGECLCGKTPIRKICILENRRNGNMVVVGSTCANNFPGHSVDNIFNDIKRIKENPRKSFSQETIDYAIEQRWMDDYETNFYQKTIGRRKLKPKQVEFRAKTNRKLLNKLIK